MQEKQTYTALITGASGGIGKELAELFARNGNNLVLVARSEDKLDALALQFAVKYKVYAKVIPLDLSKPEAPEELFSVLAKESLQVNALVNNAGFGDFGPFRETELEKEMSMMQLNMVALTHLCKLFLRQLPQGQHGRILNVSSTAAFPPGPYMAVYYASKAYVQSFSEALAAELEDEQITVTTLCPGPTDTDFQNAANLHESGLFTSQLVADAKTVAEAGYAGMMAGEVVVIPGIQNKLTAYTAQLMPRSLVRQLVKKVQRKRTDKG